MIERRPPERLVTADDLPDRDMWYDPEELDPYIEQLQRERDEAVELLVLARYEVVWSHMPRWLRKRVGSFILRIAHGRPR